MKEFSLTTLTKNVKHVKADNKSKYPHRTSIKKGSVILYDNKYSRISFSMTHFPGTCGIAIVDHLKYDTKNKTQMNFAMEVMKTAAQSERKTILLYLVASHQIDTIKILKEQRWIKIEKQKRLGGRIKLDTR